MQTTLCMQLAPKPRQALLVNTLYSLSARHIELRHAEGLPADVAQVRLVPRAALT